MPFSIVRNDLCNMETDGLILPSNSHLRISGGSGLVVAERAGLEQVQAACDEIGYCPEGSAVYTQAYRLPARYLIHAVGPLWGETPETQEATLRSAYDSALDLASDLNLSTVSLPLLSAGTYGCPSEVSLRIALEAIRLHLQNHEIEIFLVLYDREAMRASLSHLVEVVSYIDDTYVDEKTQIAAVRNSESNYNDVSAESMVYGASSARARQATEIKGDAESNAFFRKISRLLPNVRTETAETPCPDAAASSSSFQDAAEVEFLDGTVASAHLESSACKPSPLPFSQDQDFNLHKLIAQMDESFSVTLMRIIDVKGLDDPTVYKRANMSRQLFSKIRSDSEYKPTKRTALALCIALELSLTETQDLLGRAGFTLSHSSKFDVIVKYFIKSGIYDMFTINETLFAFDQQLLN